MYFPPQNSTTILYAIIPKHTQLIAPNFFSNDGMESRSQNGWLHLLRLPQYWLADVEDLVQFLYKFLFAQTESFQPLSILFAEILYLV